MTIGLITDATGMDRQIQNVLKDNLGVDQTLDDFLLEADGLTNTQIFFTTLQTTTLNFVSFEIDDIYSFEVDDIQSWEII